MRKTYARPDGSGNIVSIQNTNADLPTVHPAQGWIVISVNEAFAIRKQPAKYTITAGKLVTRGV